MEVKNLNKYFSEIILRRGYDYFKNNKVQEIHKSGNIYEALVKGSLEYKVTIDMTNDDYNLSCTCPYGDHCKHEAAVLYCLKNDSAKVITGSIQSEFDNLSSLERFQKDLEKSIKALNHKYSEYDYYDEYDYYHDDEPEMTEEEEASQYNDFANTIRCYITRSIKEANNDNDYLIATFKLLLNAVDNCSLTTYNYSSMDLYSILITAYKKQLEDKDIFARILSNLVDLRTKKDHYFYDDIDSALCENISTKWQAEYLVSYFNDLEKILEKDIFKKITIIYNFIDKEKALKEAEKDEYLTDRKIVDWLLDTYKDNIPKQIEILEKYCRKANGWHITNYYEKLLELYKKTDIQKYQKILLDYFYKRPSYDKYLEIKKTLIKEEWNKIKPEVLSKIKNNTNLYCDICLEEKEYSNVLDVLNKSSIDFIGIYIDKLATIYPEELLKLYTKRLIDYINDAKGPSAYKKVDDYLNYLLKFPNGRDEVLNLINYIKVNFPTRKSFQTEMEFYKDTYL